MGWWAADVTKEIAAADLSNNGTVLGDMHTIGAITDFMQRHALIRGNLKRLFWPNITAEICHKKGFKLWDCVIMMQGCELTAKLGFSANMRSQEMFVFVLKTQKNSNSYCMVTVFALEWTTRDYIFPPLHINVTDSVEWEDLGVELELVFGIFKGYWVAGVCF